MTPRSNIRVRPFRPYDHKDVQRVVLESATRGDESPYRGAMKAVLTHPLICVAYAALLLDAVLLARGKNIVAGIIVATVIVVPVIHQVIRTTSPFVKFIQQALREDLGDIPKYYQSGGPGREWASEFWVAEVESSTHPGSWDIAGCIGLKQSDADPKAHVRRLFVSHHYRKRGIAGMLSRTVLEHAKAHGMRYLYLETTKAQPIAISFYEKQGWRRTVTRPGWPSQFGTGLVKVPLVFFELEL
ncbi:acyl-CoA N-acyltransferase [Hymenopellis radicata]|nr:acyl-CoA N-acyltransferase [Hymenopellis radicata]